MTVREYIGARYVPLFMGTWSDQNAYEPLSIVIYQGNSYTSRQAVPAGISIDNGQYWAITGNYNAQVEQYRQEVRELEVRFNNVNILKMSVIFEDFETEIAEYPNTLLIVDEGDYTFDSDVEIPATMTLLPAGGIIKTTGTATVSVKCPIIAVRAQLFDYTASLDIDDNINSVGFPEWFGAVANDSSKGLQNNNALDACMSAFYNVEFGAGDYYFANTVQIDATGKGIRGYNNQTTSNTPQEQNAGTRLMFDGESAPGVILGHVEDETVTDNMYVQDLVIKYTGAATLSTDNVGLLGVNAKLSQIRNVSCLGFHIGFAASNVIGTRFVDCVSASTYLDNSFIGFYSHDYTTRRDGVGQNASLYIQNLMVNGPTTETFNMNTACFKFDGYGLADTFIDKMECTGVTYGMLLDFTKGNPTSFSNQDITIQNIVFDGVRVGIEVTNCTDQTEIALVNPYIGVTAGTANANAKCIEFSGNSSFYGCFNVIGGQLLAPGVYSEGIGIGCHVEGLIVDGVNFHSLGYAVNCTSSMAFNKIKGHLLCKSEAVSHAAIVMGGTGVSDTAFEFSSIGNGSVYTSIFSGLYTGDCSFNIIAANSGNFGSLFSADPSIAFTGPLEKNASNNIWVA